MKFVLLSKQTKGIFMNRITFSVLFICITTFSTVIADVSPETVVDIFQRLDNVEKKSRELHGKNEELQHQIDQLKKQQKQGFLAIDERIEQLKSTKKPVTEEASNNTKENEEPRVKIIDTNPNASSTKKDAKETEKALVKDPVKKDEPNENSETSKAEETDVKKTNAKKSRAATAYEKEIYQAAFNLMKKSPSAATKSFKEYIKMQPESPLAANSQYWIGEIMYSHNNYKGAVQEFIKVLQKYKYSDKAPDAAIKLGYSFYALKNWEYARRTFEDVLKYFPENKNAVNLASKRLEKMKAAGN